MVSRWMVASPLEAMAQSAQIGHKTDNKRIAAAPLLSSTEQDTFIPSFRSFPLSTDIFHCKRGNFPNRLQAHIFERSLLFLI
jgi:hypothetical protein